MKLIPLWLGLFIAGACLGPLFSGQAPKGVQVQAPKVVKVAVINITAVMENDDRLKKHREDLVEADAVCKARAEKLRKEIRELRPDFLNSWAPIPEPMRKKKLDLANVYRDAEKCAGKKHEDFMVSWWKETNDCVKKVAEAYDFHLVLAGSDPSDTDLLNVFPNINRKMAAMDGGGTVPLYGAKSVDITHAVTATLACERKGASEKKGPSLRTFPPSKPWDEGFRNPWGSEYPTQGLEGYFPDLAGQPKKKGD